MNMKDYTVGKQPCDAPRFEEREWFGLSVHECIYCSEKDVEGSVMFCSNCCRDHHKGGWDKCAGVKKTTAPATEAGKE